MKNYINFEGKKIALTDEQIAQIRSVLEVNDPEANLALGSISEGEICKIGGCEFIVLEHKDGNTAVILKDLLFECEKFGENNNYADSFVDSKCGEFGEIISAIVGKENLVEHTVDLTSDDGRKDYGTIKRFMSLITADMYRRFVEILDKYNLDEWWWLSTPWSTQKHGNNEWIKCVTPRGYIGNNYCSDRFGVRPFCILKSNIFVSK